MIDEAISTKKNCSGCDELCRFYNLFNPFFECVYLVKENMFVEYVFGKRKEDIVDLRKEKVLLVP